RARARSPSSGSDRLPRQERVSLDPKNDGPFPRSASCNQKRLVEVGGLRCDRRPSELLDHTPPPGISHGPRALRVIQQLVDPGGELAGESVACVRVIVDEETRLAL